ncbi:MAG: RNA methyltransferase [Bacteroidales bacterium]|nr:RNA methyltransferase [Bacteroidales bacterium]
MDLITSTQNPRIKDVVVLSEKSKYRRERGLAVVEGRRELENCLAAGFEPETVFCCPDLLSREEALTILGVRENVLVEVSQNVYSKIAYREGTEGIVAVIKVKERHLDEIKADDGSLVIVLEAVEKPGNLGAILRTADAAGAAAVIICDPLTDLYNPNLIRASIGGVFTSPVFACTSEEAYKWLKSNKFRILTAQLQDSHPYYAVDMTKATAIVFGTESDGLTDFWRERSDEKILIPMLGKLDSLNVSASVAILSYEAVRQKMSRR